jgi:hypothetical protein
LQGFDGCLENLMLQCENNGKAMTVWDMTAYHFFGTHNGASQWSIAIEHRNRASQ